MTPRAVVYARYSTGNQSPLSIDRQLQIGRALAAAQGAHVVREFTDAEISGFVGGGRPGLNALLAFVQAGGCDLVIAEHSDRLSRDGGKSWDVFNLFRALGVRYVTAQEGEVSIVHQGVSTLMSELKGEEARVRTLGGLRQVVQDGRSGGGLSYGYAKRRMLDAAGEPVRGLLDIDPAQADVVRRIFRDYAAGVSPQAIAHTLNREGVPGPRGGAWNASTIGGNLARANGIIHNELYAGVRVWGRRTFVKDRATGARRGREAASPPIRQDAPELRIVPAELWDQVRARHAQVSTGPQGEGVKGRRRPKRFLQGLIVCAGCNRPMWRAGPRDALRCATRIEKGACDNTRTPGYARIEARVIDALRANLLTPAALDLAIGELQTLAAADRRDAGRRTARLAADLAEVKRRAARILDQLADDAVSGDDVRDKLAELRARRAALEAELAAETAEAEHEAAHGRGGVALLRPAAAGMYRRMVDDMAKALDNPADPTLQAAREAVRGLITEVRFTPLADYNAFDLQIVGDLAPLLDLGTNEKGPLAGAFGASHVMRELGAGTRVTRRHTLSVPFTQAA